MNDYNVYCPYCDAEIGIPDPWNANIIVCKTCGRESVLNYDESVDSDGDESYWFYLEAAQQGHEDRPATLDESRDESE